MARRYALPAGAMIAPMIGIGASAITMIMMMPTMMIAVDGCGYAASLEEMLK